MVDTLYRCATLKTSTSASMQRWMPWGKILSIFAFSHFCSHLVLTLKTKNSCLSNHSTSWYVISACSRLNAPRKQTRWERRCHQFRLVGVGLRYDAAAAS